LGDLADDVQLTGLVAAQVVVLALIADLPDG
jgi:hypothetical protein